jgi:hypothetical protein
VSKVVSKTYIFLAIFIYVAAKTIEAIFGESDIYIIVIALCFALAVVVKIYLNRATEISNAFILIVPILVVVMLISFRYFLGIAIPDTVVWSIGLVLSVLSLGAFGVRTRKKS